MDIPFDIWERIVMYLSDYNSLRLTCTMFIPFVRVLVVRNNMANVNDMIMGFKGVQTIHLLQSAGIISGNYIDFRHIICRPSHLKYIRTVSHLTLIIGKQSNTTCDIDLYKYPFCGKIKTLEIISNCSINIYDIYMPHNDRYITLISPANIRKLILINCTNVDNYKNINKYNEFPPIPSRRILSCHSMVPDIKITYNYPSIVHFDKNRVTYRSFITNGILPDIRSDILVGKSCHNIYARIAYIYPVNRIKIIADTLVLFNYIVYSDISIENYIMPRSKLCIFYNGPEMKLSDILLFVEMLLDKFRHINYISVYTNNTKTNILISDMFLHNKIMPVILNSKYMSYINKNIIQ